MEARRREVVVRRAAMTDRINSEWLGWSWLYVFEELEAFGMLRFGLNEIVVFEGEVVGEN